MKNERNNKDQIHILRVDHQQIRPTDPAVGLDTIEFMSENLHRKFALEVVERLVAAGYQALWAGGCVRDYLMGHTPEDYDVATDATPQQVRQIFGRRRTFAVGESFGVIVVLGPGKQYGQVEVATFRQDSVASDGRRPESVRFCSAEEDARRRDLTINGLFYDPLADEVLDYVRGREDLKNGIIRAIGDPLARMQEDKLRMLRSIRFTARFQFQLEEQTAQAIRKMAGQIEVVSKERIAQELRRMFADENRACALRLMDSLGLLPVLFPELEPFWSDDRFRSTTFRYFEQLRLQDYHLALAILLREMVPSAKQEGSSRKMSPVKMFCKGLKLSNQETNCIDWLVGHRTALVHASDLPLHRLKPLLSGQYTDQLLELTRLYGEIERGSCADYEFCLEYLKRTPKEVLTPPPLLTGGDLIEMGMKPGSNFSAVLDTVRKAQLDEQIHSREEALELAGISK